ncbi:ribosome recycling factor [Candidatus Dependentiae bacterium]|nr:ribosome recycling factor [Candidatus Dependentiae bacterium]
MQPLVLEENNTKNFEAAINAEMDKAVKHFQRELAGIRSGRAHTSMIEDIKVSVYGSDMKLRDIAAISAPDANMLVIQPWDKGVIADIERAVTASDLGVTPHNDGDIIRLALPQMSSQRRQELIKVLHKALEDARVAVRNIRKDYHNIIRDTERNKKISQDFSTRLNELLQKITDKFIASLESMSSKKEEEIAG